MKYILAISVVMIFFFALMPGKMTPAFIVDNDKAVHATVFFMLALMLQRSFPQVRFWPRLMLLAMMALGIEVLQYFVADRGFSRGDLVFDGLGLIVYAAWTIVVKSAAKRLEKQSDRPDKRV